MKKDRLISSILLAALVCCLALSHQASVGAFAPMQDAQAVIPLEGLDPVLLTQGKEVMGNMKISVMRGRFQYIFANEENKALFEKNPERYEIQLQSSCARMGPQINGNPDLYSVYQERIYIFGSGDCKKLFDAAPEKYLEPAPEKVFIATPEAVQKGQALIEKAVAAMGGAAKIDGLTSLQETGVAVALQQQKETEYKLITTRLFPDYVRQEQARVFGATAAAIIDVHSANESFVLFKTDTRSDLRSLSPAARADVMKQTRMTPLEVLRARKQANFKAAFIGSEKAGDTAVEQVAVMFDGIGLRLGIEPSSGHIVSLAYRGRNRSTGEIGEIKRTYSDFRAVDGLTQPFKTSGSFNGQPDLAQSYRIETLTLNAKIDPALFEKPKPVKAP
jgi:YHS domain-containing protein